MSGTYRDLKAWQRAFDLTLSIYEVTRAFPKNEAYGLTSQVRRAAVSVVRNIAEGKGRCSDRDTLRFLANARGSLFEIETQVTLAGRLSYLTSADVSKIAASTAEVGRLINGLIRALDPERSSAAAVA